MKTRACLVVGLALLLTSSSTFAGNTIRPFDYIDMVEDDHDGDLVSFERSIIDPDHSLIMNWREDDLKAAFADRATPAIAMSLPEEQQLIVLRELIDAFLATQASLIRATTLGASTLSEEAKQANREFSVNGIRALNLVKKYQQAMIEVGLTRQATEFRKVINELVLDEESYDLLAKLLTNEVELLNARVSLALESAPKRGIQMRATLVSGGATRSLHLEGYDTYDRFDPVETPRFQFDLDERAELEVKAASDLGVVIKQAMSGELKKKLQAALKTLQSELKDLLESLKTDVLEKNLKETLDQIRASGDANFNATIEAGETLLATLKSLRLATPPFESQDDAELLLHIYRAVTSQISGLVTQLGSLPTQIKHFRRDVVEIMSALPDAIAEDTLVKLHESLDTVSNNTQIAAVIADYNTVRRSLGLSLDIAEAGAESAQLTRDIQESLDTRLDLLISTPGGRYSGDLLILEVVITEGEGDTKSTLTRQYRKIRLQQLGLRGEIRAALIFSDPQDDAFADQSWEPTPAMAYMFHYGRKSGRFWNEVLDPGLGIGMTVLDYQDDDDFELGLSLNVSVFRSLLWTGYGRNIQAETNFFYIGVNPLVIGRLFREGGSGKGLLGSGAD